MPFFSKEQIAAAVAAAAPPAPPDGVDWARATVTTGGGVAATVAQIRKARGKNKLPIKEPVALRIDQDVLAAFRKAGPGWQTRINAVLRTWAESHNEGRRRSSAKSEI